METKTRESFSQEIGFNQESIILGREREIEDLVKHFDHVLEGDFAACLIRGKAGVGKTYFVSAVARKLLNVNASYIYGKYKHYNNSLFSAMNEVIKEIVEHALTFPEEKLKRVKELLAVKLGNDSNLILSICPEAEKLFGFYRRINEEDYHKLEYKFYNAISIFLDIMSQELYPLMIHIDDLQWADEGSIRMIDFLCRKGRSMNFYLLLSFRDDINEKKEGSCKLTSLTEVEHKLTLKLRRLNEAETKDYLNVIMKNEIEDLDQVSQYFFQATLGTPFYLRQLIETIIKEEKIQFDPSSQKCVFELEFLKRLQLPEDIQKILVHQSKALSSCDYEHLQLLACLGGQANNELLKKILLDDCEEVQERFENLCGTGLVIQERNVKEEKFTRYYFSHDIIYELMHGSMEKEQKAENHYKIVNRLIHDPDKIYNEEHRIFIATQLLDCKELILKEAESTEYVLELYYAGIKAKQLTLIEEAVQFFELCLQLIPLADPSASSAILWKLKFEFAECLFVYGETGKAETLFGKLIEECKNQENLVKIKSKFILLYTYSGAYRKALSLGLEVLEHLDFNIRTDRIRLGLFKEMVISKGLVTNKKMKALATMPSINDQRILTIERTLLRMAALANLIDEELFVLLILRLSNLSVRHGNSEYSAPAYAAYAYIAYHILGEKRKAFQLAEIARELAEDKDDIKCMTYFILGTFIEHWKYSCEKSLNLLMEAIEVGVGGGEFQYAGYSFSSMVEMKYVMGKTIEDLVQTFELLDHFDSRLQQDITESTLFILQNHLDLLTGRSLYEIEDMTVRVLDSSQKLTYYYFKLQRLYVEGRRQDCYHLLEKIVPIQGMFKGYLTQVDLTFFMTMVRLDQHEFLTGVARRKNKRHIDKAFKQFDQWVNGTRENHNARYLYLKAKRLEVFRDSSEVGKLYEQGIAFAKERKQLFLVALGELMAANYYEGNKKIAEIYRQEVVGTLREWGAIRYANLLEDKYLINQEKRIDREREGGPVLHKKSKIQEQVQSEHNKRLAYDMKQVEGMDKDNTFLYMLDKTIKQNAADYGAIYLEKDDQIYKVYEHVDGKVRNHSQSIPIEDVLFTPHKVIRYVVRTGKQVIINEKPCSGLFVHDMYFSDKEDLSILCIPLKYMDVFAGIVYVEWNEKDKCHDSLIDDIKSFMPLLIAKSIAEEKKKGGQKRIVKAEIPLTKRETEVFQLIIKGFTNKQIGKQLCISLSTVKTHIINIYSKLDIKNRVAAVEKAKALGFID